MTSPLTTSVTTPVTTPLERLRRHRGLTVLVLAILAVLVVLTVVSAGTAVYGDDLDPQNPEPGGAQAVARVLGQHGVDLTVVRRAAGLARAQVDADTTVLVTSPGNLGRRTARQVGRRSVRAGAVVLAAPGPTLISALGLPVRLAEGGGTDSEAGCDDPFLAGLSLDAGPSRGYRRSGPGVVSCFGDDDSRTGALVVRVDRGAPVYALGGAELLSNDRVDRADNAAAALRLLGQHRRLLWYVPDARDVAVGDSGSFAAQLPRGLLPALCLVAVATLATLLWRGRRLGPLVVEPLPVSVKAVESTQGRGRLYRRVRDRSHAAGILRAAASRRLATRLRLPPRLDPALLIEAVARATGADPWSVHDLLVGRQVPDDTALIRLAADLAALEKEVHDA